MQQAGVTILFVSHDFKAVEDLCTRVVWLDSGEVHGDGETSGILTQVKQSYHRQTKNAAPEVGAALAVQEPLP
jgi:ABC-type glutathione transport system ATPase component